MELPPEVVDEDELDPANVWIWRAWSRLTDERHWQTRGFGVPMGGSVISPFPCKIPWSSVIAWAEYNDYSEGETLFLDVCISSMDDVFITWSADQMKSQK
jgi:hypothetical protein